MEQTLTPNTITTSIEKVLAKEQIVIKRITLDKRGWAMVYEYTANSTIPPIRRLFNNPASFRHYKSIEECFVGEYNRIVLGIDDGHGTILSFSKS